MNSVKITLCFILTFSHQLLMAMDPTEAKVIQALIDEEVSNHTVLLRNGTRYIPKELPQSEFDFFWYSACLIFEQYYRDSYGEEASKEKAAFLEEKQVAITLVGSNEAVKNNLRENGIAYKNPGQSMVDGNNIRQFDARGQSFAIISDHAIVITFWNAALLNSWPKAEIMSRESSIIEPSFYHVAHGVNLVEALRMKLITSNAAKKKALEAITPQLKAELFLIARRLEAIIAWAKDIIAEELEMPLENIIFIPQREIKSKVDYLIMPGKTAGEKIILLRPPAEGEKEIFSLQEKLLKEKLGNAAVVVAPEIFSDPSLFGGVFIDRLYAFGPKQRSLGKEFALYLQIYFAINSCHAKLPNSGNGITSPSLATAHANFVLDTGSEETGKKLTHECVQCKKRAGKISQCSQCKEVKYCSVACQRAHWPKHKDKCKVHDKKIRR